MMLESYPWKMEVQRHQRLLQRWSTLPSTERGDFYIERAVFLSAFILRKMMENKKVTDALRGRSIRCRSYVPFRALSDRVSRFLGVFDPANDYDMADSKEITLSCFDLMSEIMHSYVFHFVSGEQDRLEGFLVNSYNKRDDRLLFVELSEFDNILTAAIADNVMAMTITIHPNSGTVTAEVSGKKSRV